MPPAPQYLVRYNGYQLPGYSQGEAINSSLVVGNHQAPYADASLSEQVGLENKSISVRMKLWECSFDEARQEAQKAATYLRSNRETFAPLFIQRSDRYYEALTTKVSSPKEVGTSLKIREYQVDFEAKPWVTQVAVNTIISSSGTILVSRNIDEGGWTPTIVTVTGTDVTISGYTADNRFAGFMSIDGTVSNLVVNSDDMSVYTVSGVSSIDKMLWADFGLYVGPKDTTFVVTGASNIQIQYQNRWYI